MEEEKEVNQPESINEITGQPERILYEGVRGIAVKILNRIDRTDAYLDKLMENELKNNELNGQDKALLFEIVHGVARWTGRLDYILGGFYKGQFSKSIPNVKNAMRVALYQILFLDKIPDYAAVNEAVEFIKKLQGQKPADFTNAILRNIIRSKESIRYPDPGEDLIGYLSCYYSHPVWLIKRWLTRYGREQVESLLTANNERPGLTLRINSELTTHEEFKKLLDSVKLRYYEGKYLPGFFKLKTVTNITDWEYFEKGYFSVQDESTGFACILLDPKPDMRVIDLCAAPGGKTTFISNLMQNQGELIAVDKYESRIKLLNRNISRLNIKNVTSIAENALNYNNEKFDRVLLDAPCSGLGTLSKKPDIKWKRELSDLRNLTELQYELIKKAAYLLNPGGALVYSTCTIEPEENFGIVSKFLANNPDFQLHPAAGYFHESLIDENGCVQSFPHIHKIDGAFCARIDRIA